jgi:uncharacterized protein
MGSLRDIHSRLDFLAKRKKATQQNTTLSQLRQGQVPGIASASDHFKNTPSTEKKPKRLDPLDQVADAVRQEGPRGSVILRSFTLEPGQPNDSPFSLPKEHQPTFPAQGFPLISKGFPEDLNNLPIEQICFLDTETTGLAGGTGTVAFLVGLGWWKKSDDQTPWQFRLEQYLIDDFPHEAELMPRLIERLSRFTTICTYNGKSFDWPLLRTRAMLHRIPPKQLNHHHLDLLHFSRRLWAQRLGSVTLKNVELSILDFDRGPDIDGAEIPDIFFQMARSGHAPRINSVLDHNAWDIISLSRLLEKLSLIAVDPLESTLIVHWSEHAAMARWLEQRKSFNDATRAWKRALKTCCDEAQKYQLMERLALCFKRLRQWDQAIELWKALTQTAKYPNDACWIELAKYYEHQAKDYQRALKILNQLQRQLDIRQDLAAYTSPVQTHGRASPFHDDIEKRTTRITLRLERMTKPAP